jgi:NRDE-2, necessary for RNA interference
MLSLTDSRARRLLLRTPRPLSSLLKSSKREKDDTDDFIRLSGKLRKQDTQTYRSINSGDPKSDSEESSSSSASGSEFSDEDDTGMHLLSSRQATLKSLEEQLRHDPSSVHTWLALLAQSTSVISLDSKNAVKTRAEITVSILSRAMSAHTSNKTCTRLRLRYLKAGEEVWDERRLITEWEAALGLNSVEIWMAWLDWRISIAKNGVEGIIEDAERALIALGSHNEVGQLRVQWRVAVTLRQAGRFDLHSP